MSRANELSSNLHALLPGTTLSRSERAETGGTSAATVSSVKAKLLLVTGLYVAALLWAYATIVEPEYGYEGFTLKWPSAVQMAWLVTVALLPASFLPSSSWRPSALVVWWLYLTVYIPAIIVPALSLSVPLEKLLQLQLALIPCMGLLAWVSSRPRLLRVRQMEAGPTQFWPALVLIWVICIGIIIALGHFSSLVSNITSLFEGADEYTIRGKFAALAQQAPLLGYLTGPVSNAIDPFLMAFGLRYRRTGCFIAGVVGQAIVFSLTGFKTALTSIVFLALLFVFVLRSRRSFGLVLTAGLVIAVLASTVIDRATNNVFLTHLITRRTIMTPGLITGFYFEHYSQIGPLGMGYHFAALRDNRVLSPAKEIGFAYWGNTDVNANANLWASGYAEAGLYGMFLYTIFTAFLIWIYDSIAAARDPTMAALLLAMPAATVSNTLPTTTLITHGALAAALLLYFAPLSALNGSVEPELSRDQGRPDARSGTIQNQRRRI
jgi:hypothetical protein